VDASFIVPAREERQGFAAEERGCKAAGAGAVAGWEGGVAFDGDPGAGIHIQDLQTRRVADDEREQAEIFVLLGIDGRFGALRAVIAEHAKLSRCFHFRQRGARHNERVEDGCIEIQGLGDGGNDFGHEGAGEIPGGFEIGVQDLWAAGGGACC